METPKSGINFMKPQGGENKTVTNENQNKQSGLMAVMLDRVMTFAVFMLFFGLPLFFTSLTFQGIAFEKQLYFYFWLLLALVVWAARGVITGEMKIKRTPLDIPILAFWLLYLISTILSVDRWHSFWGFFGDPSRGFMGVTALVVAYYLLMSNMSRNLWRWIITAIVVSGAILSVWTALGIMGVKFLPESLMRVAPLSLVGSLSGLGMFFGAMIPVLITVVFKLRSDEVKPGLSKNILTGIVLAVLAIDFFLLLALYAFVPWIGVLVGMGFFLIFILAQIIRPVQNWTWLPMLAFVGVLVILMIGATNIARVNLPAEVSPSYKLSLDISKESLGEKAILGSGPATYGYGFSQYRPEQFNLNNFYNLRFYQGTGLVLESIPSIGVLGTVALVLLILSFVSVAVYLLAVKKEKDKTYSLGLTTAAFILLYAAVTARIEGTLLILTSLVVTLALAMLLQETDAEEKYINLSLKASPKFALALAFVFMVISAGVAYLFVFMGKIYAADIYAGSAAKQGQVTEGGSVAKFAQAANLNNREGRYFTRIGQEYMVLANNEILKEGGESDVEAARRYLNNSIAASVRGRDLMPTDVLAVESLAQIYENAGLYIPDSLKLAEETYQSAQKLEPHNPNYYVKLGQIKTAMASSEEDEARKAQLADESKDMFQKSIEKKENFAPGYYFRSLSEESKGEIDAAVEDAQKAFSYDRSSINYAFNLGRLYQVRGSDDDNKKAETLFKQILGVNDKELNTHFSLGLLYEKTNKKKEAVDEYRKVIELLPPAQADVAEKIEQMIANIQTGSPAPETAPENPPIAPVSEETPAAGQ